MTPCTNEMVVIPLGHQNIMCGSSSLEDWAGQAEFSQQIERAVHRHPPDVRRGRVDLRRQIVRCDMPAAVDQRLNNNLPRRRQPVAVLE